MPTNKTYDYAGVSRLNGVLKLRFAQSDVRAAQLVKLGDTDVNIIQLTYPMSKAEAIQYLISNNFAAGNEEIKELLLERSKKYAPAVPAPTERDPYAWIDPWANMPA